MGAIINRRAHKMLDCGKKKSSKEISRKIGSDGVKIAFRWGEIGKIYPFF